MGYPYPNFCLCAFLRPYLQDLGMGVYGLGLQKLETRATVSVGSGG